MIMVNYWLVDSWLKQIQWCIYLGRWFEWMDCWMKWVFVEYYARWCLWNGKLHRYWLLIQPEQVGQTLHCWSYYRLTMCYISIYHRGLVCWYLCFMWIRHGIYYYIICWILQVYRWRWINPCGLQICVGMIFCGEKWYVWFHASINTILVYHFNLVIGMWSICVWGRNFDECCCNIPCGCC